MFKRTTFTIMVLLFSSGCALTTATLNVNYDSDTARKGPLSSMDAVRFSVASFKDARSDTARIGFKKNLYGMNMADILTKQPVEEVVRNAVISTLKANGHDVGEDGTFAIEGEVTKFWFDTQVNFWTIEFIGSANSTLRIYEKPSGTLVYERAYNGYYDEKSMGGLEGSWERVMNASLARMVESIMFDQDLVAALKDNTRKRGNGDNVAGAD